MDGLRCAPADGWPRAGEFPRWKDERGKAPSRDVLELADELLAQAAAVDARLVQPAFWRGELRRDRFGRGTSQERASLAMVFNGLVRMARRGEHPALDMPFLLDLHRRAIGGGRFRSGRLRVGAFHEFPPPARLGNLVELALDEASDASPAPLRAMRLHLRMLDIHPFPDGNGRTSRLLASAVLLFAGFRSTLLSACEQFFEVSPSDYVGVLDRFRSGDLSRSQCTAALLTAAVYRSRLLVWFRAREKRLSAAAARYNVPGGRLHEEMLRFERGEPCALSRSGEKPLAWLRLGAPELHELTAQLSRILEEERCEPR